MIHPLARAYLKAQARYLSAPSDTREEIAHNAEANVALAAWFKAGAPIDAPPPPNTVKVRVAVSVAKNGDWAAGGGNYFNDEEAADAAQHTGDDRLTWITAHVPLPEPAAEIEGKVGE